MKKLDFKWQIRISLGLLLLCFVLATATKIAWLHKLGWIIYGLMFILNPVWPKAWDWYDHDKLRLGCRIAGVLCIVWALITRFGV